MTEMNRSFRIMLFANVGVALITAGCGPTDGRFRPNMLPGDLQLIGGGLNIHWEPPEPGTAYLVEKRTDKIIETRTLAQGEPFVFEINSIVEAQDLQEMLGVDIDRAEFLLYFKPQERPRSVPSETP